MLSEDAITEMLANEKRETISSATPRNNPELLDKIKGDGDATV